MTVNSARFDEGTEIVIDTEVEAPATGWTLGYCSVNRIGALVALHIELTCAADADPLALTLQDEFAPAETVTTPDGKFHVGDDGTVTFTGSTSGGTGAVCEAVYQAGQLSP